MALGHEKVEVLEVEAVEENEMQDVSFQGVDCLTSETVAVAAVVACLLPPEHVLSRPLMKSQVLLKEAVPVPLGGVLLEVPVQVAPSDLDDWDGDAMGGWRSRAALNGESDSGDVGDLNQSDDSCLNSVNLVLRPTAHLVPEA